MATESASETEPSEPTGPDEDAGDRSGAPLWLEQHGDALYRHARLRVRDRGAAEDLVQETLLAALQAQGRFRHRSSVRTWLLSILRHKIIDHYRRDEARPAADGSGGAGASEAVLRRCFTGDGFWRNAPSSWKSPEAALLDDEFRAVLDGCLGRLPRSLAEAFLLRELEQAETGEICQALGLSPGNLRIRLHRAHLLLRDCLERRWFGSRAGEGPSTP